MRQFHNYCIYAVFSIYYQLNSIVEHHGSHTDEGHYTAKRYNHQRHEWTYHDDEKDAQLLSPENVITKNAYIIFYVRTN